MDVNAKGVFLGTKAAIPAHAPGRRRLDRQHLLAARAGRAWTQQPAVPGLQGRGAAPDQADRASSTRRSASAPTRCIPGPIVTPMTEARRADPAHYEHMLSRIPLGRYGEPDEVAYGVLYLASDESRVRDRQRAGDRRRLDGAVAAADPRPALFRARQLFSRRPQDDQARRLAAAPLDPDDVTSAHECHAVLRHRRSTAGARRTGTGRTPDPPSAPSCARSAAAPSNRRREPPDAATNTTPTAIVRPPDPHR